MQSLLYAVLDAGYISSADFKIYYEQAELTIRLVTGFRASLK